jgi:hypothetical protein
VPTLAGITYVHTIQYFAKGIDGQGPYYDVAYQIDDWSDSDDFANALVGIGTDAPHRHPLSTNLVCVSAVPEGKGRPTLNSDGLPQYAGGATVRATYRSPGVAFGGSFSNVALDDPGNAHQIDPTTPIVWCTQELDFAVETLSTPNSTYYWEADSAPAQVPVQVDIPILTLVLTFHRRASLPVSVVRGLLGKVNENTFLGAPDQTVLFRGARTTREASTDGTVTQKVQLTFQQRPVSWNKFLRPNRMPTGTTTTTWDNLRDADGYRRFDQADLSPLVALP